MERPHVYFQNDLGYSESEDNLAFYGGHTSFAFSVIAADQHYLTDILIGSAVGGLIGWAVPRIFHSPIPTSTQGPSAGMRMPPVGLTLAFQA